MITEDYVSFETAKLLKEKGFPQEYDRYHSLVYNEKDYEDKYEVQRMVLETKTVKAGTLSSYPVGVPEPKCYCCTLQMAMKWLRDVHKLGVFPSTYYREINRNVKNDYGSTIVRLDTYEVIGNGKNIEDYTFEADTYEETADKAIRYCLENLI